MTILAVLATAGFIFAASAGSCVHGMAWIFGLPMACTSLSTACLF